MIDNPEPTTNMMVVYMLLLVAMLWAWMFLGLYFQDYWQTIHDNYWVGK